MVGLFVTSTGDAAGKTALCAGLARKLQESTRRVGFLKATCADTADADAELMKRVLALDEPVEALCPVRRAASELAATADAAAPPWLKSIQDAYAKVGQGKDIVVLEGPGDFGAGTDSARVSGRIVDALGARAILIVLYRAGLDVEQIVAAAKMLGDNFLGVVINAVPEGRFESVKAALGPSLESSGVRVLGVLPDVRALSTVTVSQLAEHVGGSILNSQDRAGELVENLMVGAMSVDSALSYLTLKPNKAVITRGDRPDIQLAALETSTRCLVLTGNIDPPAGIVSRALELDIPIVLVQGDTVSTLESLDALLDKGSFFDEKKLETLGGVLERHLDLRTVYSLTQL